MRAITGTRAKKLHLPPFGPHNTDTLIERNQKKTYPSTQTKSQIQQPYADECETTMTKNFFVRTTAFALRYGPLNANLTRCQTPLTVCQHHRQERRDTNCVTSVIKGAKNMYKSFFPSDVFMAFARSFHKFLLAGNEL